ncbi:hypothetical protein CDO73_10200 [Saccharibacillus sp. O23]|uniref:MerR family transcriptional regulator n=1 Tax=Saccharibacillus sp. O23 TaxID=2009338 RepID=UPI000B4E4FD3|nr:MerR family transcriptional regulator [Saccharibacillus sp. O23]OWR30946.1 hypothetical protein CDO73_10200 [Saccharibacillus sp. O23]
MIRIGVLAKKTNLSKRTLRYYEQIGLLKPSAIEANGYRYYDESAVVRLHRILLLKSIGYTLRQIRELLGTQKVEGEREDWLDSLHRQIELMEKQKEELSRKQYYLRSAIDILRLRGVNGMNDLLGVIEGLNGRPLVDGVVAAEFGDELPVTPTQKAILQRLPVWGSGDERLEPLLALFRQAAEMRSSSPHSAEAQALAGRIDAVSAEMFEGDRQLLDLYWEWMKPTTGEEPAVIGFDSGLTDYVDQMMAFYYEQKESEKDEKT